MQNLFIEMNLSPMLLEVRKCHFPLINVTSWLVKFSLAYIISVSSFLTLHRLVFFSLEVLFWYAGFLNVTIRIRFPAPEIAFIILQLYDLLLPRTFFQHFLTEDFSVVYVHYWMYSNNSLGVRPPVCHWGLYVANRAKIQSNNRF